MRNAIQIRDHHNLCVHKIMTAYWDGFETKCAKALFIVWRANAFSFCLYSYTAHRQGRWHGCEVCSAMQHVDTATARAILTALSEQQDEKTHTQNLFFSNLSLDTFRPINGKQLPIFITFLPILQILMYSTS